MRTDDMVKDPTVKDPKPAPAPVPVVEDVVEDVVEEDAPDTEDEDQGEMEVEGGDEEPDDSTPDRADPVTAEFYNGPGSTSFKLSADPPQAYTGAG